QSGLFANVIPDYTLSHASSLNDGVARYLPLTNGKRNAVRETVYYTLAPTLRGVLPTPPNPPSPYRDRLADKVVLDVWGGPFADQAAWLQELASYRITHLLTICHDWQNGGYDNKLPDVLPAQAGLGGDAGMQTWAHTAVGLGEFFALHENYVDFYPNAPSYNEADVARDPEGMLVPAWKNLIQSYAVAPNAILKYARKFTPDVHARYHTNASYLDVHSAVPPWFHVDFRADQPGAGEFATVWNTHRDLWKLFRETHQGPVLGEGANHWYWSGLLDGVEAQFGVGVPSNGGQTAPLFVDFDLWNIHPLQFNHGMGYLERWLSSGYEGEWQSNIPTMQTLDQYRMQEVAYGHAGFIAAPLVRNLPFLWQEHNLMWPLTSRYATAQVVSIRYEQDGALLETEAALRAGSAFDRVEIRYDNGLTIWANGRAENWTVKGSGGAFVLPQYGWLAEGKDFRAGTLLRSTTEGGSVVADSVETPGSFFVNARSTFVLPPAPRLVLPGAEGFAQLGDRRFRITYTWDVHEEIPAGYTPFIHVTGQGSTEGEGIVFQTPSGLSAPPDRWPVGRVTRSAPVEITLPPEVKDGDYALVTGIYAPMGGDRLALTGRDDGHRRYALGTLTVSDNGRTVRFQPAPPFTPQDLGKRAERAAHANPLHHEVGFQDCGIRTNGSFLLERERDRVWLLTPFPRDHPFHVQLQSGRLIGRGKLQVEALDAEGHSLGQVSVVRPNIPDSGRADFDVNTIPGAVRYRIQ
ncbi:MAG TPA: DUF5696 domain-containing protein, partial [Chthonomonadaceae bacterium]|nr:DUF5696 domain-containing protein [Chthonomonadaceae bacterium]